MGKGIFVIVDGVPRKVKKAYIYDGAWKKIKKAYINVDGVMRNCFAAGADIGKIGNAQVLSIARYNHTAVSFGGYALFGGGEGGGYYHSTLDAYNAALTKSYPAELNVPRSRLAATTVGNYALFGGGYGYGYEVVDSYDTSLTRGRATDLNSPRNSLAAARAGNYALFAGGVSADGATVRSTVDAYDTSLTRKTARSLSQSRYALAGATVGEYAIFAGGKYGSTTYRNTVNAYNSSLTMTTPTSLDEARCKIAATTIGNYAIFVGGEKTSYLIGELLPNPPLSDKSEVYDASLTRVSENIYLFGSRAEIAATTIGQFALFAGGVMGTLVLPDDKYEIYPVDKVCVVDSSLTGSRAQGLDFARRGLAAASVGDYALFAGGQADEATVFDVVDVYTIVPGT